MGADAARARLLWVCYRLTPEEYEAILQFQNGVCGGCGEAPRGRRLAVDHDHRSGRIRGLLCWLCNRAIGILRDNDAALTRLGEYLRRPPAVQALSKETYGLIGKARANKKVKVYGPPTEAAIGAKNGLRNSGSGRRVSGGRKVRADV